MRRPNSLLVSALVFVGLVCGEATRTKDKIYDNIEGSTACFRRLNGTHQFGCASQWKGSVGVLQLLKTDADVNWLIKDSPDIQFIAVVGPEMFTRPTMIALKESKKLSGIVLLKSDSEPNTLKHFSQEDSCPNRYSGLSTMASQQCSSEKPWNPQGTGLMHIDWGFPIFFVHNQTSIDKIRNCTEQYNSVKEGMTSRSLCAIEMEAFMLAAKDSETCIRRSNLVNNLKPQRYCDPMGDRNIWATLLPRDKSQPEDARSVIVLAARLDTTSMFDGEAPGAVSTVTGLVSALSTYQLLTQFQTPQSTKGNVMLVLFNGEAYDYIGSSRLVYDMAKEMFPPKGGNLQPFDTSKIRILVELNQLSQLNKSSSGTVPMFFHKTTSDNAEIKQFVDLMAKQAAALNLQFSDSKATSLPPVSLQSFVKADKQMPGVVLTDYDQSFSNSFFHSIFDDASLINFTYMNGSAPAPSSIQTYVANLSTALARSIYEMLTSKPPSSTPTVNPSDVDEMLHCYLNSMNCKLFQQAAYEGSALGNYPPALYVGVTNGPNVITDLTGRLIALLTGTQVPLAKEECKSNRTDLTYQYLWMRGKNEAGTNTSICMQTTMNYTVAASPAFEIEDYDWKSGEYSTWTESVWTLFNVRIFLKPSSGHEAFVISFGSVFLFLSVLVVFFVYRQSDLFFNSNTLNGGC